MTKLNKFFELPYIQSISPVAMSPYWAEHWHTNSSIELIHILQGRVKIQFSDRKCIDGEQGDTLLVPPSTKHKDQFDMRNGIVLFYIHFSWTPIKDYLKVVSPACFACLSKKLASPFSHIFERMKANLTSGYEIDSFLIRLETLEVLLSILKIALYKNQEKRIPFSMRISHKDLIFDEACQYIRENYTKPITLEDVANSLRISPFYLSHIFNERSNFSFNAYLNNMRLEKALQLLRNRKLNISEISYAVGYEDNHYFSRIFKKKFGITPSQARLQFIKPYLKTKAK